MNDKLQQMEYYRNLINEINQKQQQYLSLKTKLSQLGQGIDNARSSLDNAESSFDNGGFVDNHKVFESESITYCKHELYSIIVPATISKIDKKLVELDELKKSYTSNLNSLNS